MRTAEEEVLNLLASTTDEDCTIGSVDDLGWYALVSAPDEAEQRRLWRFYRDGETFPGVVAPGTYLFHENDQGQWSITPFDSWDEGDEAFARIVEEYNEWYDRA